MHDADADIAVHARGGGEREQPAHYVEGAVGELGVAAIPAQCLHEEGEHGRSRFSRNTNN